MTETVLPLIIGASAGLAMASLGALKDTRYGDEQFSPRAFVRSPILGAMLGLGILWTGWPCPRAASPAVLFLAVMALERLTTETYKLFLRPAPAGRRVPSQAAILGRPIESPLRRMVLGLCFVAAAAAILASVGRLGTITPGIEAMCFGLFAGVLVAVGGAWKDAPIEGWSTSAFLRSPLLAAVVAVLISMGSWSQNLHAQGVTDATSLFFVCLGGERLLVESYKAFIRRRRPSKFFEPVNPPEVAYRGTHKEVLGATLAGVGYLAGYLTAVAVAAIAMALY